MSKTRPARPIPIALTALVAFFSALAALAVSNGMNMAQAHGNPTQHATAMPMTVTVHPSPSGTRRRAGMPTRIRSRPR